MIRVAIVGWGNVGKAVLEAALEAPDMQVAGVVRRAVQPIGGGFDIPVAADIKELGKVDIALLCAPSRLVPDLAVKYSENGISTADSFDIHTDICDYRKKLDTIAKANGTRAVISAGWDPGSDSLIRALLLAAAPKGLTHTNFGPGMSMGHSVAVKAIEGVEDALSMTIPMGESVHRRMVYVQKKDGADFAKITETVKNDPYFVHDETYVYDVESVDALKSVAHGVDLVRKGVSGRTHNQSFRFSMTIDNPALTGQLIVSCARAALRQAPGAYTMIELPVIDMLPGDRDSLIRALV